MHSFQPFSLTSLEFNPFEQIGNNLGLVAAGSKSESNIMTIGWGGVGPVFGKNCVFIFVRDSRYTKEFIDKHKFFSVSALNKEYQSALEYCGQHTGKGHDKWAESGLTMAVRHGIPYPDEASVVLLCEVIAEISLEENHFIDKKILKKWYPEGDYHTMYIAEIAEIMAR